MPLPNRVSAALTDEESAAVLAALATVRQKLPFLVSLKPEERKRLPRIDEGAQPWTSRMLEVATNHPDFLPKGFDLDEMKRDVDLWRKIIPIHQELTTLLQLVSDTYLAVSTDAYAAGLTVYAFGSKSDVATEGLEALMDELGKRFARKSGKSKVEAPEAAK